MKILLALLLLISQTIYADDCAPVNLVTIPKSPFQDIPVMDQGNLGICYAYASAQLIDYELIKNGQKRSIHPLWVALKYAESRNEDKITAGISFNAIKALKEAGNCSFDNVSTALGNWTKKANARESDVLSLIEKVAPELQSLLNAKKIMTDPSAELTVQEIDKSLSEIISYQRLFCPAGSTLDRLIPELRSLSVMTSPKLISKLVLPVCENPSNLNITEPVQYAPAREDGWIQEINKNLDNRNSPVSISFCSKVLDDPSYDGIIERGKRADVHKNDCGGHEALIVGKKNIGGSCHLLLRNSRGTGFNNSTKNWKCLCKNKVTGQFLDDCTNDKHNNGKYTVEGCWIDAKALEKNMSAITYLNSTPIKNQ